ncbi:MAG: hypothetical protein PHO26_02125 [Dehalococcoidia bacterium]|nr:hypothetical protein [Dehalococcoidia bacterium]MDD5495296.1 hypothetical protein [Dehalococcoidia bacterium]
MMMQKVVFTSIVVLAALLALIACQAPVTTPAVIEVTSLDISSPEIDTGQSATISCSVTNTGGTRGLYSLQLIVNGSAEQTKAIDIYPGDTQAVAFTFKKDTAGAYKIDVGGMSSKVIVKSTLVSRAFELQYDDGNARDYISLDKPATGYLVSFSPPSDMFSIDKIKLFGVAFGGAGVQLRDLEVQVWDKNKKTLYKTMLAANKFPEISYIGSNFLSKGGWVELKLPEVQAGGDFYIHIYAGVNMGLGFHMGVDDDTPNTHSDVTLRDSSSGQDTILESWPFPVSKWYGEKKYVNWMVRVSGLGMVPE